ncbi:hypothetical protein FEM48_Zijuj04G0111000 [Ziziphus jujuba var. spinosa]|uniref:Uncharacterized protein n=1 Tax=Ziziphus jujuba var. spinosa TaxID=714518 RepID=A0A978VJI4_ZIZJJ|nr:hypothetical protein FEM48_Zijuj04G0111000 [Ziziphus jujuba var. spinosa]
MCTGQTNLMESVPDLHNSMYKVLDGYPCVRLLNLSGEIGCSNPGREKVLAPIIRFKNANELSQSSAILLSMGEFQNFFKRISNDSTFARNVGGVLVESGAEPQNMLKEFSPARKFPQAEFSPYRSTNYKWNPIGSGIMWNAYNFPVFLLSESGTLTLQEEVKRLLSETHTRCNEVSPDGNDGMACANLLNDEIVSEQLTRNIQFFGLESQQKVTTSYVVSLVLEELEVMRLQCFYRQELAGFFSWTLTGFPATVSLSSLNRHAVAKRADVGIPKAQCLKEHFSSIFPECHIKSKVLLYDAYISHQSFQSAISKQRCYCMMHHLQKRSFQVALLAACVRRGLKVLSATEAGARADPTRIHVADLRESTNDPLSRYVKVRHRLRRDYGIDGGIPVVFFSLEKPKAKLLPFKGPSGEEENPSDYQIVPGFRVRIIPVLGTIPAIFGQVMASYVVTQLAGLQVQTEAVVNLDVDHYRTLHQRLIEHEESLYGTAMQVQVDVDEVMYIAKELWHGRSARELSANDVGRGMWRSVNELMLVRWDREKPASVSNLILLKFKEADEHESMTLDDIKEKEPEFFNRVTSVLKRAELEFDL